MCDLNAHCTNGTLPSLNFHGIKVFDRFSNIIDLTFIVWVNVQKVYWGHITTFKFVNIQIWDCYQLFLHTGSELSCNLSKANNVCKICEFMTYNDYTMNIQFVNFYCSSTKLTANIVQGLCLFLTHICSMLQQTNTKYQLFDFPADYFAVGLTVGLFLRGSVSESYQNNDISPSKHWYIFVPHFEILLSSF